MSALLTGRGIQVFDADGRGGDATGTLSCTDGTLTFTVGDSGVTVTDNGSDSVSFEGTIAQIDAFFRGDTTGTILYENTSTGALTFSLTVTDEDNLSTTIEFPGVVGTFAGPTVVAPGGTLTPNEDVAYQLEGLGFDVSDSDDTGEYATMVIDMTAGGGTITASPGNSGVTVVSDNGTDEVTLVGTIDSLSDFLTGAGTAEFSYLGDSTGSKTLRVTVTDSQGQTGTASKTFTVRSAPVVTSPTTFISAQTSTNENIEGQGFSYTDSDDGGAVGQELVLSTDTGQLTVVAGNSGATVNSGSPSGGDATPASVNITGTKTQLNNLLQGVDTGVGSAGTIVFLKGTNGTSTLTATVTDNDGLSDAGSASIVVAGVATWTGYAVATPKATTATIAGFVAPIDLSKLPQSWWDIVSADGRDIRVTLDADGTNTPIARDLVPSHFDKTLQKGTLYIPITNGTVPPAIRVWAGASSAVAPAAADPTGQHAVYNTSFIRAWWPDGGGDDRTSYGNDLTGQNGAVAGDTESPFGLATNYLGSRYSTTSVNPDAITPAHFGAFINASDRTHETVIGQTTGTATNICRLQSSKVTARTIISDAFGTEVTKQTATAVGDIAKGAWRFVSASFLSDDSRIAYREGANAGTNSVTQTGSGATDFYMVGATVKNPSSVVADTFRGYISLSFVLTGGISSSLVPAWFENYKDAFDQETYWGTWQFSAASVVGL